MLKAPRYTLGTLKNLPTLKVGTHYNLKLSEDGLQYWLCAQTRDEEAEYVNEVHVFQEKPSGPVLIDRYDATDPRRHEDWDLVWTSRGDLEIQREDSRLHPFFRGDEEAAAYVVACATLERHPNRDIRDECRQALREVVESFVAEDWSSDDDPDDYGGEDASRRIGERQSQLARDLQAEVIDSSDVDALCQQYRLGEREVLDVLEQVFRAE